MYTLSYILLVQNSNGPDPSHYQMLIQHDGSSKNFALAFMPPNTTDKYYVIPQWMDHDDMALLTIHKNPYQKDKFVFQFMSSEETVAA